MIEAQSGHLAARLPRPGHGGAESRGRHRVGGRDDELQADVVGFVTQLLNKLGES